ncbi:hypothetical protein CcaverHIS002_0510360 [Cutaneotrichosporon cavernicola]|nr:hypothetical protein CcaverHIS002_0510360 [Cutaneotrichosporon cavernicola]BEJ01242.1 hypothetical protein CcaverHIS631_0510990 [Cutaneotrichosporon cavernicola]BEJ09010.1 hypothetical protein CcaverHIS641_0511040 [Cutaneotrichosporon cavernicola]
MLILSRATPSLRFTAYHSSPIISHIARNTRINFAASHISARTKMTATSHQMRPNGPTPPLTPKSNSLQLPFGAGLGRSRPNIHREQSLLRLQHQLDQQPTSLMKHSLLSRIRREDPELFFAALQADLVNLAPVVYTPTVGEACQKYSQVYSGPEGLYLSIDDKDQLPQILSEYAATLKHQPQIIVVTDGSRILGLGDLGLGGMGISVGKLNLYVAGGGLDPSGTLPVVLDMGTNNESIREDPLYLGLKRPRASFDDAVSFMDDFMAAASNQFPDTVIQHEDFYSEAAFEFLSRYQSKYCMFNDDIQGTGSVILGGFVAAAKAAVNLSGRDPKEHKVVFLGGGSAAIGVAKEMMNYFRMLGLSEDEARERFWLIDTKGLITATRQDVVDGRLAEHKKYFIRNDNEGQEYKTLLDVIEYVKPTTLVGLSTTFGAFPEPVVRRMAELNQAPIIFPLSNPTSKCELSFEDALNWTDGRVLYASGSPYDPVVYDGQLREPGQGNNFLVFPGIGLGALLSGATHITDDMITASAISLSEALTPEEKEAALLYPRLTRIRDVSADVAVGVIRAAQKAGLDTNEQLRDLDDESLLQHVKNAQWSPYHPAGYTGPKSASL